MPISPRIPGLRGLGLLLLTILVWSCAPEGDGAESGDLPEGREAAETPGLGPVDGRDLPPTEIGRVALGTPAPDFSLESLSGDTLTLSDFRGRKDVILVFYRGHW